MNKFKYRSLIRFYSEEKNSIFSSESVRVGNLPGRIYGTYVGTIQVVGWYSVVIVCDLPGRTEEESCH